ncbi:hypothetical protein BT69DRAFT_1286418, partial [Atractiella rhizophila]
MSTYCYEDVTIGMERHSAPLSNISQIDSRPQSDDVDERVSCKCKDSAKSSPRYLRVEQTFVSSLHCFYHILHE